MGKKHASLLKKGGEISLGLWELFPVIHFLLFHKYLSFCFLFFNFFAFGLPFFLFSFLLEPSQVSNSRCNLVESWCTSVYRDYDFFFACLSLELVSLENRKVLTFMSFLLFIVDCSLLVMLQLHGPFTELAAAFS